VKDRSNKQRSYSGDLMNIGGPAEAYITHYLQREYIKVVPIGIEKHRRDYRCYLPDGTTHLVEAKTDTVIANSKRIPWGYASSCFKVVYYVPQWMKLLDIRTNDIRRFIFQHIMSCKNGIFIRPALTDSDRITFNFLVPLNLLRQAELLREVEVAQIPLAPSVAYQPQLYSGVSQ